MKKINKPLTGNVYRVPINKELNIFVLVLLDINSQCIQPKLIAEDSPLALFEEAILVELYRGNIIKTEPSDKSILIPGIFIDKEEIIDQNWELMGTKKINPKAIEFPESILHDAVGPFFIRGEIKLALPGIDLNSDELEIYPTRISSIDIKDLSLYHLNLKSTISDLDREYEKFLSLSNSDARFSEIREKIYEELEEDENQSYFEMSSKYGHDISKFY